MLLPDVPMQFGYEVQQLEREVHDVLVEHEAVQ